MVTVIYVLVTVIDVWPVEGDVYEKKKVIFVFSEKLTYDEVNELGA